MRTANLASAAVLATGLLLAPGMAGALTINETSPGSGIATDIEDLDVGGTLYDVLFVRLTANNFYGGTYDFGNATDANAAVDAINAAFNNSGFVFARVGPTDTANTENFYIGYADGSAGNVLGTQGQTNTAVIWENLGSSLIPNDFSTMWAGFSPAGVPEPAAAWLLGSCLIGLIGVARSKKA
jgi:hypothetical protein